MDRLVRLLGTEHDVDEVARDLYAFACEFGATVVGALHVTCADEAEREGADAFQRGFAEYALPALKFGQRSPFRIANLGGRYEQGAVRVAEDHFALPVSETRPKLMLVKLNAHVAVRRTAAGSSFGAITRYGVPSTACGALRAVLDGSELPFARDLREALRSDGHDRLATVLDAARVPPALRSLFLAVTSVQVQAQRAVADIGAHRPRTPTQFVVMACVTLNRTTKDAEIVCGLHHVDWTAGEAETAFRGLGDDPARYRLSGAGRLEIRDDRSAS